MNRFTKFTLLTAVLLCIIGGILVTAGIAGNGLNDLADAIKSITNNNDDYIAFKKRFVSLCDGHSCERFVKEILEEG